MVFPMALSIVCQPPLLVARFAAPQRFLSWSLNRPGYQIADTVVWLEVRNADLPLGRDAKELLVSKISDAGMDAIGLLTSHPVSQHHVRNSEIEGVRATCLATVGVSNAERVGSRRQLADSIYGTINILAHVSEPLSDAALVEAVSVIAQARTAAMLDAALLVDSGFATGTGTDCIVVGSPVSERQAQFSGLHTAIGEALGAAVYDAVHAGTEASKYTRVSPCQKPDWLSKL